MDQENLLMIARRIVARQCRRFRISSAEVEDVVQDVVEKYLRRWETPSRPINVEAWLETTTRHTLIDRARREDRRPEVPIEDDVVEAMKAIHETPSLIGVQRELIRQILSLIPHDDADLLQRRYLHGASASDLAAALGITVDAVDQRTTRAKSLLRERLEERPDLVHELYATHPRLY